MFKVKNEVNKQYKKKLGLKNNIYRQSKIDSKYSKSLKATAKL